MHLQADSEGTKSVGGEGTLQRIEAVRRQLNDDNVKSLAETEQIQTLEVLGEGTFGKVYKVRELEWPRKEKA